MKPDFDKMDKDELRHYIITHQNDREAFQIYVDRLTAQPTSTVYPASLSPQEIQEIILSYHSQKQNTSEI